MITDQPLTAKPLILFDFDNTLMDTRSFARQLALPALAEHLQVSLENLHEWLQTYKDQLEKNTDFDPEDFLGFIEDQAGGDVAEMRQLWFKPEFYTASVYPDAVATLRTLARHFTLGVFTEGVLYWQQKKIELTNLSEFFEEKYTIIARRKTKPEVLDLIPPETVIVDDNRQMIQAVAEVGRFQPVWAQYGNREPQADDYQLPPGVKVIESLSQLPDLLQ